MIRDDFDTVLRSALTDAANATHPDPDLADRLVQATRPGRVRTWRRTTPLLAAAAVIALAVGIAAVVHAVSGAARHEDAPGAQRGADPACRRPLPCPSFHAANLYFADAEHGWALGDAACPSGRRANCPALLTTTDSGTSWRALAVPKGLVSTFDFGSCSTNGDVHGPCVDSVAFADPAHGYLWSLHELYWTTDGGRTWTRLAHHGHPWAGAAGLVFVGNRVVRLAPINECSSGCAGSVQSAPLGSGRFTTPRPAPHRSGCSARRWLPRTAPATCSPAAPPPTRARASSARPTARTGRTSPATCADGRPDRRTTRSMRARAAPPTTAR